MVVGEGRYGRRWPSAGARKILVGRLRARRGEIEEEIFARIRDERFESTGSDDAEYVAGLRAATVAALEHVLNGIERGGVSSEPAPAAALVQVRRAARFWGGARHGSCCAATSRVMRCWRGSS